MNKPPEASRTWLSQRALQNQPMGEKLEIQQPRCACEGSPSSHETMSVEGGREEPRETGSSPVRVPLSDSTSRALRIAGHVPKPGRLQYPPPPRAREAELGGRTAGRLRRPGPALDLWGHAPAPASPPRPLWVHQATLADSSKYEGSCNQQRCGGLEGA